MQLDRFVWYTLFFICIHYQMFVHFNHPQVVSKTLCHTYK